MNFQRGRPKEDPEINLIPMIDVLLVVLIFLMITTTYSKFSEMEIILPQANAEKSADRPNTISISISATGGYSINRTPIKFSSTESLSGELRAAAGDQTDPIIIINADANATHQSVITVMEAARLTGFNRITFMTEERSSK
ncbi:MAG: biopolymer transporter ExbD [Nitrosomonadaceae bacterium]|jgi:biopolymer transport protein ExbD|nr:biopolymer transporter ExbD [Nitrosomonadaceae bacterium]MDW7597754.1 biopolymer transporter ExbD [Nitrosomonadaceae bacterium]MDW7619226.1 biopolymer transporter ExbD [Nitrosomonadaceae bacterium]MDW7647486.1 biopolymer transporter ExbD [Nitrosomonadaceae bacterium]MDW7666541.1 biopolymer transporter ExbD [Nitrosomonadaceae bacterium]